VRHVIALTLLLTACGAAPPPPPPVVTAPTPPPPGDASKLAARGLPGHLPWKLAVLVGDGVDDLEVYGLYYALVSQGWQVSIAAPSTNTVRAANGRPIPVDVAFDKLDPAAFDVLYVPGGAPPVDVIKRFADATIATTAAGARTLAAAGLDVGSRLATDDQMVRVDRNLVSCARPGDLPALAHALTAYADDVLRQAHATASPLAR
jgi:putative intracellular protease/amidase